jgi:hypothetical protein
VSAGTRRMLRMMAGEVKSPAERSVDREMRKLARIQADTYRLAQLVDKIQRRENNDPELPPMPLNFEEIMRRQKEGK